MADASEGGAPALVKMSELARRSGVPAPTIKHYIREGLLPGPVKRTGRNMAWYDARVAARVRAIKRLQTTRFLPLRVIGELLEPSPSANVRGDLDEVSRRLLGALAPAIRAGAGDLHGGRDGPDGPDGRDDGRGPRAGRDAALSRDAALRELAIEAADLARMAELGLIDDGPEAVYAGAALELLEIIDETRRRGLGELFPIEILAPYAAAIHALVAMEIDLFRSRVLAGAALPADTGLPEVARQATRLAGRMVLSMRDVLVLNELGAVIGD